MLFAAAIGPPSRMRTRSLGTGDSPNQTSGHDRAARRPNVAPAATRNDQFEISLAGQHQTDGFCLGQGIAPVRAGSGVTAPPAPRCHVLYDRLMTPQGHQLGVGAVSLGIKPWLRPRHARIAYSPTRLQLATPEGWQDLAGHLLSPWSALALRTASPTLDIGAFRPSRRPRSLAPSMNTRSMPRPL